MSVLLCTGLVNYEIDNWEGGYETRKIIGAQSLEIDYRTTNWMIYDMIGKKFRRAQNCKIVIRFRFEVSCKRAFTTKK